MAHQETDTLIKCKGRGLREPVKTERGRTEWGEGTAGKGEEDITVRIHRALILSVLLPESDLQVRLRGHSADMFISFVACIGGRLGGASRGLPYLLRTT